MKIVLLILLTVAQVFIVFSQSMEQMFIGGKFGLRNFTRRGIFIVGASVIGLILTAWVISIDVAGEESQKAEMDAQHDTDVRNGTAKVEQLRDSIMGAEMLHFRYNVSKSDSIITKLQEAYSSLQNQEKSNSEHYIRNIEKFQRLLKGMNFIIAENRTQFGFHQQQFQKNFDSISNLTSKLQNVAHGLDMENYPLVPIELFFKVHVKYDKNPFDKTGSWINDSIDQKWLTFSNKEERIDYHEFAFPVFINEEEVIESLRSIHFNLDIKKDSNLYFRYSMNGITVGVERGAIVLYYNAYDDYSYTITHSKKNKELIFSFRYDVTRLIGDENFCNCTTFNDFKGLTFSLNYVTSEPRGNLIFAGNVSYRDSVYNKIKNSLQITLKEKRVEDHYMFSPQDIYLGSNISVFYGKKYEQYVRMKKKGHSYGKNITDGHLAVSADYIFE